MVVHTLTLLPPLHMGHLNPLTRHLLPPILLQLPHMEHLSPPIVPLNPLMGLLNPPMGLLNHLMEPLKLVTVPHRQVMAKPQLEVLI